MTTSWPAVANVDPMNSMADAVCGSTGSPTIGSWGSSETRHRSCSTGFAVMADEAFRGSESSFEVNSGHTARRSRTERAMTYSCQTEGVSVVRAGATVSTVPHVGFSVNTPQNDAG